MRTLRSLLRSRYGPWILLGEAAVLAGVMIAFWWMVQDSSPLLSDLARALVLILPLALLVAGLLPALAFVAAAVAWEMARALAGQGKGSSA
jgi:hypothetical protein